MPTKPTSQDILTPLRTQLRQALNRFIANPVSFEFDNVTGLMSHYEIQYCSVVGNTERNCHDATFTEET